MNSGFSVSLWKEQLSESWDPVLMNRSEGPLISAKASEKDKKKGFEKLTALNDESVAHDVYSEG